MSNRSWFPTDDSLPSFSRRARALSVTLLLAVLTVFPACGGGSGGASGTGGGDGPGGSGGGASGTGGRANTGGGAMNTGGAPAGGVLTIEEFPMVLAQAKCTKLYECCAGMPGVPAMMNTCVAQRNAIHLSWRRAWLPSVMSGKLVWNGDRAKACADALRTLPCNADAAALSALPCGQLVSPQVALGGDCTGTHECQMSWCDTMGTGKCEEKKAAGASCRSGDECSGGACEMMTCAAQPATMPTTCSIL